MKKIYLYVFVSAIVAFAVTNFTDSVVFFAVAWFNLFLSIGSLAFKLDK